MRLNMLNMNKLAVYGKKAIMGLVLLAPVGVACLGWKLIEPHTYYQKVGAYVLCIGVWYFLTLAVSNVILRLTGRE